MVINTFFLIFADKKTQHNQVVRSIRNAQNSICDLGSDEYMIDFWEKVTQFT